MISRILRRVRPGRVGAMVAVLAILAAGCAWIARVSVDSAGNPGNDHSRYRPSISDDGRFVAFLSAASNLAPGGDSRRAVFVRDTRTGTTTMASVDPSGMPGNSDSEPPAISGDGRYVAFPSYSTNLVAGDSNGSPDVFVRDLQSETTTRVSVDSAGGQANSASCCRTAISGDGRYVAFLSRATDLVPGDTNGQVDVFVHDRVTAATTRVNVDSEGNQAEGSGFDTTLSISTDGRYVAFASSATNLVPDDTNGGGDPLAGQDVFVHDRVTGITSRVSVDSAGNQTAGDLATPQDNVTRTAALSADGRYVSFRSDADDLVAGDTNGESDVFVHDRVTGITSRVSVDSAGNQASGDSRQPALSGDGRYVTFRSTASDLVAGDTNAAADTFVHDRTTRETTRTSLDGLGLQANGASKYPTISPDGNYVAFASAATNLVADPGTDDDLFIRAHPQPAVTGVAPSTLAPGTTTAVIVTGRGFVGQPGLAALDGLAFDPSVTASNVTILSQTRLAVDITVSSDATSGPRSVFAILPGTGPGVFTGRTAICAGCLTITAG